MSAFRAIAVAQSETYDAQDRNLAQTGLFMFEELDALRNELDTVSPLRIRASKIYATLLVLRTAIFARLLVILQANI